MNCYSVLPEITPGQTGSVYLTNPRSRAVFAKDGGHILITEFRGMALNGLLWAEVLRPLDLVTEKILLSSPLVCLCVSRIAVKNCSTMSMKLGGKLATDKTIIIWWYSR